MLIRSPGHDADDINHYFIPCTSFVCHQGNGPSAARVFRVMANFINDVPRPRVEGNTPVGGPLQSSFLPPHSSGFISSYITLGNRVHLSVSQGMVDHLNCFKLKFTRLSRAENSVSKW